MHTVVKLLLELSYVPPCFIFLSPDFPIGSYLCVFYLKRHFIFVHNFSQDFDHRIYALGDLWAAS